MIAYVDSSVVLRIVLQQAAPLAEWSSFTEAVSSVLLPVECRRSLDRLWQMGLISADQVPQKTAAVRRIVDRLHLQPLDDNVLKIAGQPFPAPLGTLDALHLATAMIYRDARTERVLFATHDKGLARGAAAMNFEVIG